MKSIIYLFSFFALLNQSSLLFCQVCNSGEFYSQPAQSCQLCSSVTQGCLLCDQSTGECLICSGLYLSQNLNKTSICTCPSGQLLTYNPQQNQYQCANRTIGNSYYNQSQLLGMSTQLSMSDLQVIESAVLGVNGVKSTTIGKLKVILQVVENGADWVLEQNATMVNQLAKVLTAFGYVEYSDGGILNSLVALTSFMFYSKNSNYVTMNYCMEIFGLVFDKLTNLQYGTLPTSFFANIQGQFDNMIANFIKIKYTDLGPEQQVLTNHYTNIWIASLWVDLSTSFYVMSDLALEYSLSLTSDNLTGLTQGETYMTQIVIEKSPIAYFPGNAQKLVMMAGVVNLQFFQMQNGVLMNVNSQLLSNPSGMILGFPTSTNDSSYFVNWDRSLELWEEDFQCINQNNHAFCKANIKLSASSYSFSISEQFKYSTICNAGEYQKNAASCALCSSVTDQCVSCNVFTGECYLCKGLYPAFSSANGTLTCSCQTGYQKIYNITASAYQCVSSVVANQLFITNQPIIQNYTSDLTISQLQVLEQSALGINGNNSLSEFQVIINILQNAETEIIYSTNQDLFLQYLKVLVAIAYNPASSYKIIYQLGMISNQIRMSSVIIIDDQYYFMEMYGLINKKISEPSFSWDGATVIQKKFFILQTQTYVDNIKRAIAMQLNLTQGDMRSYHFTNFYLTISNVNVSQKFGSGLLQNQYAVEIDSSVLQKIPANNTVYAIHLLQEQNPFTLLNSANTTLFTSVQDISFYYGNNFNQANSYLINLSQQYVKLLYPYEIIQTYKMQLDYWSFQRSAWQVSGYCSQTATNVASCYPPSLASSDLYVVAKNATVSQDYQIFNNKNQFLKRY